MAKRSCHEICRVTNQTVLCFTSAFKPGGHVVRRAQGHTGGPRVSTVLRWGLILHSGTSYRSQGSAHTQLTRLTRNFQGAVLRLQRQSRGRRAGAHHSSRDSRVLPSRPGFFIGTCHSRSVLELDQCGAGFTPDVSRSAQRAVGGFRSWCRSWQRERAGA